MLMGFRSRAPRVARGIRTFARKICYITVFGRVGGKLSAHAGGSNRQMGPMGGKADPAVTGGSNQQVFR